MAACERAREHPQERAVLDDWLRRHNQVRATLVPASSVGAALGGPVRGYAEELGVYELAPVDLPGQVAYAAALDDLALAPVELIQRLPPLVR